MHPFTYQRTASPDEAVQAIRSRSATDVPAIRAAGQFIAGGTNMSDYMRLGVMRPDAVIDVNHLNGADLRAIRSSETGLEIGALVRMAEAEDDARIQSDYPVIYDTLKLAATRQIRNMASLGGNVLQRTRCPYFRETSFACNKRDPGSGCSALDGVNREHAVLGASENCIAAYAGDFAQALMALDAKVHILGDAGPRTIAFADLHRLPGDTPDRDTNLAPGDLIVGYTVPAGPHTRRSRYVKVRDRDSYQFALTSVAVALAMDGDTVTDVRIALGGVAAAPWRAREAEDALRGKTLDETAARNAAVVAFRDAAPREHNAFKVPIGQETIVRALLETRDMDV